MAKPEIRLKGFKGEWHLCSLGSKDFTIVAGGDADKNLLCSTGKFPVVSNGLQNDGIVGYYKDSFRIKGPAVTVTGRGDIGFAQARHYSFTPVVRLLSIQSCHNVDFLANSINRLKIIRESTGVPQLTTIQLAKQSVYIPEDQNEELPLADYFNSLDSFILATSKKIASLKQMKSASLISMFPQKGETKPRVRFKGFEGEWKKVKLGTLTERINRKSGSDSNAPVMMISASSGFIEQSEKYSSDNAGKSLQNYTLLYKGELAYNHGASKLRQYGSCFELHVEEARIPYVYHCFRMKDGNSTFFAYYLNSGIFDPELRKIVSSTARMDGLLNISYEAYMSIDVYKCSLAEQEKIASFFKSLDKQISLQEQRLEKLKQIKAACLDKMFV